MNMEENKKSIKPVQLRGGFSDRHGIKPLNTQMQFKDFDEHTRMAMLNTLHDILQMVDKESPAYTMRHDRWPVFYLDIATNVYNQEADKLENFDEFDLENIVKGYIRSTILFDTYDGVLTLIEYILNYTTDNFGNRQPHSDGKAIYYFDEKKYMNKLFEKEYVGYRFIDDYIVPITDDTEIKEIEETLDIKIQASKKHIEKALGFLSDREKPDYKNSVKESISAIEAACKVILGNDSVDLSNAIKKLKDTGIELHPALLQAIDKLYAYAGDKGGVRHSEKSVENNVTFEEAKFILVTSCALVNYLIAEYGKN